MFLRIYAALQRDSFPYISFPCIALPVLLHQSVFGRFTFMYIPVFQAVLTMYKGKLLCHGSLPKMKYSHPLFWRMSVSKCRSFQASPYQTAQNRHPHPRPHRCPKMLQHHRFWQIPSGRTERIDQCLILSDYQW